MYHYTLLLSTLFYCYLRAAYFSRRIYLYCCSILRTRASRWGNLFPGFVISDCAIPNWHCLFDFLLLNRLRHCCLSDFILLLFAFSHVSVPSKAAIIFFFRIYRFLGQCVEMFRSIWCKVAPLMINKDSREKFADDLLLHWCHNWRDSSDQRPRHAFQRDALMKSDTEPLMLASV